MWAKLKTESQEFHFGRRLIIQTLLSALAAHVHLDSFLRDWQGASVGEYIVYSLTQQNYFLVLFPFLCLVWTSGKGHEACRYPLLIRYRTREEHFCIRFLAKSSFAMAALAGHVGMLLLAGHSLPAEPQMVFVSSRHPVGILFLQFLNLFCYICVILLLYELLADVAGNAMLGVMLAASVSLMNLLAVKLMLQPVVAWTPWGNIAYQLSGQEQMDYRFHGIYWLVLIGFLFYAAQRFNGRKDYVFEETRQAG